MSLDFVEEEATVFNQTAGSQSQTILRRSVRSFVFHPKKPEIRNEFTQNLAAEMAKRGGHVRQDVSTRETTMIEKLYTNVRYGFQICKCADDCQGMHGRITRVGASLRAFLSCLRLLNVLDVTTVFRDIDFSGIFAATLKREPL